jgi:hypothetical protein
MGVKKTWPFCRILLIWSSIIDVGAIAHFSSPSHLNFKLMTLKFCVFGTCQKINWAHHMTVPRIVSKTWQWLEQKTWRLSNKLNLRLHIVWQNPCVKGLLVAMAWETKVRQDPKHRLVRKQYIFIYPCIKKIPSLKLKNLRFCLVYIKDRPYSVRYLLRCTGPFICCKAPAQAVIKIWQNFQVEERSLTLKSLQKISVPGTWQTGLGTSTSNPSSTPKQM